MRCSTVRCAGWRLPLHERGRDGRRAIAAALGAHHARFEQRAASLCHARAVFPHPLLPEPREQDAPAVPGPQVELVRRGWHASEPWVGVHWLQRAPFVLMDGQAAQHAHLLAGCVRQRRGVTHGAGVAVLPHAGGPLHPAHAGDQLPLGGPDAGVLLVRALLRGCPGSLLRHPLQPDLLEGRGRARPCQGGPLGPLRPRREPWQLRGNHGGVEQAAPGLLGVAAGGDVPDPHRPLRRSLAHALREARGLLRGNHLRHPLEAGLPQGSGR
mmetsp:Transcript_107565/g.304186  ORF Transcript_107565/g.304186 Transcript_107565/m.304186 type:complete len:269 (-) Transcript_107565:2913-3719(-)